MASYDVASNIWPALAAGCGAISIGNGSAAVELGFAPDVAEAAAVRNAVAGAARDSPFLQPGLFAAAEMVVCSVQAGAELSAAGREAVSAALAIVVGPHVPQIITATRPEPSMRGAIEVTVMLVNQPDDVYKPRQGGVLRTSTRPTLNLLLLLRASV